MGEKEHVLELNDEYNALVVDDSDFMVKNLKRLLSGFGTEVIGTAEDGQEAVEFVQEHKDELDYITLDITMPEMDGIEALEDILDIAPNINVIMVSAMGQKDTVKKCVMKGADHFIVKPFERDDVFEKIQSVLEE